MPISGNLRVEIEFDRAVFRQGGDSAGDLPHEIVAGAAGEAAIRVGGSGYLIRYGPQKGTVPIVGGEDDWTFRARVASLAFPLRVRGWHHGDRLRTRRGRRSLKRVFLEQRIPRERRSRLPLLVDAAGDVLWVAGLAANADGGDREGGESFILRVLHD